MKIGSFGRKLCVGVGLAAMSASALAQFSQPTPNFGSGRIYREDPATALGRHLRVLMASPQNLEALTGAGRAALLVGDPQAAIGFYARAEAIAPRNGRVKAGLGSALVLLNQQQAALRYFDDAVDLGVPEADIASDRGLAHDLRGSAKRAQRDYAIALKRGEDPETTRRMALSLAISGERDAALALLDPLLRKQDTAAWRARAFVLAMTGDTPGASKVAEAVMTPSLAAGFVPFFRKLPSLRPGEKAAAVHFGNFPGEGRPMRIDDLFNQAEVAARVALENTPRPATDAGSVGVAQSAFGRTPGRIPDAGGQIVTTVASRVAEPRLTLAMPPARTPVAVARPVTVPGGTAGPVPTPSPLPSVGALTPQTPPSPVLAPATSVPTSLADGSASVGKATRPPLVGQIELPPSNVAQTEVAPSLSSALAESLATPVPVGEAAAPTADTSSASASAPVQRLAGVAAALSALPAPVAQPVSESSPPAATPRFETVTPPAPKPKVEGSPDADTDSRVWVQVAGGTDMRAFSAEWSRLRNKAPDLLTSRTAWTTPLRATNRLLVGPFESQRAAQDFVNKLALKGITAFAWTSAKGQTIARLATR